MDAATKRTYDRAHNTKPAVRARRICTRSAYQLRNGRRVKAVNWAKQHGFLGQSETAAYAEILIGDPCAYCGAQMEHFDHIIPKSRDGELGWTNITAACARCNYAKRRFTLLGWLIAAPWWEVGAFSHPHNGGY